MHKNIDYILNFKETNEVEYKEKINFSKDAIHKLIQLVCALANEPNGGKIVCGVSDKEGKLIGIDESEINNYDPANISNKIENFLLPKPRIEVDTIEHDDKKFLIIHILSSNKITVIFKDLNDKSNKKLLIDGGVYVRRNTKTIKAGGADLHELIEQKRSFNDLDILNKKTNSIEEELEKCLEKEPIFKNPHQERRQVTLVYKGYSDFDENKLKKACDLNFQIGGNGYPYYSSDFNSASRSLLKKNNGYLGCSQDFIIRQTKDGSFGWVSKLQKCEIELRKIDIETTLSYIYLGLFHALKYIEALNGSNGEWKIKFDLKYVGPFSLITTDHYINLLTITTANEEHIIEERTFTFEGLKSNIESHTIEISKSIFSKFKTNINDNILQKMLRKKIELFRQS
jgi:hypothetical protein